MAQSTFGPASQPELAQISSEHVGWFAGLNAALFYADHGTSPPPRPRRLADWVRSLGGAGLEDQPAIAKLVELHDEMHERAERLLAGVTATGARPEEGAYLAFTRVYEEFAAQLGRVERAFSLAETTMDPLTGLRSRFGMHEALAGELERMRRTGQPFCIAIGDLDFFKDINDAHGHDIGDDALIHVAAAIDRNIRAFDEAFRMGGEEFLICLKETDLAGGVAVLERLRAHIADQPVPLPAGGALPLTVSFGVVPAAPLAEGGEVEAGVTALIKAADEALYAAKQAGRNRVARGAVPVSPAATKPRPAARRLASAE